MSISVVCNSRKSYWLFELCSTSNK